MVDSIKVKINAIFFDIGGVLLHIYPNRMIQYISDATDISPAVLKKYFPSDVHEHYERGQISDDEWFAAFKAALPQPNCLKEIDFWGAWNQLLGQETDVVDIVIELKQNYPVWLLSNTNPRHIRNEIDGKYAFSQLADGTVYSFETGYRKPEKEIFKIAAGKAGADPSTCLLIDDNEKNVAGSESVGFVALHYRNTTQLEQNLESLGVI